MRKKGYEQESGTCKKRNNTKRKKIVRDFMIVFLCAIAFLCGRATAEAKDYQSVSVSLNQGAVTYGQIRDTLKEENYKASENAWNLMLVNKSHPLEENFSVDLVQLKNGQAIDKRAYPDLQAMMDDARAAGLSPYICSSYRTTEKQTTLYNNLVNKYKKQGYSEEDAKSEAGKWVAIPGTSEHQLGLAVDIVSQSYQVLDKQQASTAEQLWLMENCFNYGFILRYPSEKSDITSIGYEPWHYRYVGKEAAAEIMKNGVCLEEYLDGIS